LILFCLTKYGQDDKNYPESVVVFTASKYPFYSINKIMKKFIKLLDITIFYLSARSALGETCFS